MKKGFTLIEILGVITILALILILIIPSLIGVIKSKNNKKDEYTMNLIYSAADLYIKNNQNEYPKENGKQYCIAISDLVNSGYIKEPVEINSKDITNKGVSITYNNGYNKEIKDLKDCFIPICKAVDQNSATKDSNGNLVGNIPTGEYNDGDEYICDVLGNGNYDHHFFVLDVLYDVFESSYLANSTLKDHFIGDSFLSTQEPGNPEGYEKIDVVYLILDSNISSNGTLINENIEWMSPSDAEKYNQIYEYTLLSKCTDTTKCLSYGPITALEYLAKATSSWKNIPPIDYYSLYGIKYKTEKSVVGNDLITFYDDISHGLTSSVVVKNVKSILPSFYAYNDDELYKTVNLNSGDCYLSSATPAGTNWVALAVSPTSGEQGRYVDVSGKICGVRPVIQIPKVRIQN